MTPNIFIGNIHTLNYGIYYIEKGTQNLHVHVDPDHHWLESRTWGVPKMHMSS